MPINITKMWDRYYQFYLDHFAATDISKEEGLPYLRDKLFISVLLLAVPICSLAYIPGIIASVKTHQLMIGIIDTVSLLVVLFIFMSKSHGIRTKKLLFSIIFYILAITLLIYLGVKGPGIIILLCISVLITLFQSKRAGLVSVVANAVIYLFLVAAFPLESPILVFFQEYSVASWLAVGLNLIAFNTLAVLSVATLVDQLNESFLKEKKLQLLLKRESLDLINAKQMAEESDRLKSAFLANMSHEIRTPMNGILGFSDLLSEPDLTGEVQQKYISIIQKSGVRMLNILNEIIDISRIESGQVEVNFRETNINTKIEYVYNLLKPETDAKGIYLSYKIDLPANQDMLVTDGEKLYAILINLVKNAIKYTDAGSIEFGYTLCPAVFTGPAYQPAAVKFFVKDTGIGIPANRQEAIFDRFIQADVADVQAREGAGLGLSISKAYVEMLNGRIWVESEPGKGSIFYFTIPYQVESAEKPAEKKDELDQAKENQTAK
jgi:signal transduction histidine kinase